MLHNVKTKRRRDSTRIYLPKKTGIKPHEELLIHIERMHEFTKVGDIFGKFKLHKPTAQLLKEVDRELYPE